jgi:hypothetical protein
MTAFSIIDRLHWGVCGSPATCPKNIYNLAGKIIDKTLQALAFFIVAILIAGVTGLSFYVWPTDISDKKLEITPAVLEQLSKLQAERKFDADLTSFYPGAPSEASRAVAQAAVDELISSLRTELPARPQRSTVLRRFKIALVRFDDSESEERDQFLVYLNRTMQIVGISDSGELLNVWRHGFPYGWLLK